MLGEASAGLSSLPLGPVCGPPAWLWQGRLPSAKEGKRSSLHLRRSRIRKGTVRCPAGVGRNGPPPPAFCALHRGGDPGPALAEPPRAHGRGPVAEGVRSPRVIANSKEGGGEELVAEGVR